MRPTAGRAEIFGLDSQHQTVEAHRRLAYVPDEANLWPSLTGTETLHLLGRIQGRVDSAYRDELIERFALDPSKKARAYSKGNRQKLILIAALQTRPRLGMSPNPCDQVVSAESIPWYFTREREPQNSGFASRWKLGGEDSNPQ